MNTQKNANSIAKLSRRSPVSLLVFACLTNFTNPAFACLPTVVNFTDPALKSHVNGGGLNTIVQPNLLEMGAPKNESYYGLTQTVNFNREVYIKFQAKWDTDYDFGQGVKMLRVRAYNEPGQENYWDSIVYITSVGSGTQQAGKTDSNNIVAARNAGNNWTFLAKKLERERWYTFQFHYLVNSAQGVADGRFRMWIDGVLASEANNLDLVGPVSIGKWNPTINRILWGGWYSNGAHQNAHPNPEPVPAKYQMRNASVSSSFIPN